jgi:Domain of unknown function (DUF5615)
VRLLLDECVPKRLGREFVGHEVVTVAGAGWAGLSNGELLRAAAREFDAFVSVDQGVQFQQNLAAAAIAIIVLVAPRVTLDALRLVVPNALEALRTLRPGQLVRVIG